MRFPRSVVFAVALGTAVPAQSYPGERAQMVGLPAPVSALSFARLTTTGFYEHVFLTPGDDPTDIYTAYDRYDNFPFGAFRLAACRYDSVAGTTTPLTDYDGFSQAGDRFPSVSRDRRKSTFSRNGSIMLTQRLLATGPWDTPVAIQGITPGAYSPYLTQLENGARLAAVGLIVCVGPPTSQIELYELDPALAIATRVATFVFAMQRLADYWQFAAPIEDPVTGLLVAMMLCYRQGFPNNGSVLHHLAGVNGKSPVLDVYGASGNVFSGGSMLRGGGFVAVAQQAGAPNPPAWTNNAVLIDMVFTTAAEVDANGGWLDLRVYSPPGNGVSALLVGFAATGGTPIPNVWGNLALQPGFLAFPILPTPSNGVAQWRFLTAVLIRSRLLLQALWVSSAIHLGGTAELDVY